MTHLGRVALPKAKVTCVQSSHEMKCLAVSCWPLHGVIAIVNTLFPHVHLLPVETPLHASDGDRLTPQQMRILRKKASWCLSQRHGRHIALACSHIDRHNRSRQSNLITEKKEKGSTFDTRTNLTLFVMTGPVDVWFLCKGVRAGTKGPHCDERHFCGCSLSSSLKTRWMHLKPRQEEANVVRMQSCFGKNMIPTASPPACN